MLWQFLVAAAIAVGFVQLGALSVWVSVLSLVLKTMLAVVIFVAMFAGFLFAWRRYKCDRQGR